jgi:FMN-dependent NADH-azoreductase
MNILHLDSSALGGASVTRQITGELVTGLRAAHPSARVSYRDLAADNIPHLNGELLAALRPAPGTTPEASAEAKAELVRTETLLSEFLAADVVVIGAPMYNFSVPTQLKGWIDRVAQAGRTFRYTATGPEGLAGGKQVIIVSSRGSMLSGSANEVALDHQEAYLRTVFGFLGITDVTVVRAEGIGYGPEARTLAIAKALAHAETLAGSFADRAAAAEEVSEVA